MDFNPPDTTLTILIIDDAATDRTAFRRFLTRNNDRHYHVEEAESGEEGLEKLKSIPVDLVLLDYYLPDMDGLEILKALAALMQKKTSEKTISEKTISEKTIPVIMLTGQGDERTAVESMKAGASDYIVKQRLSAEVLQLAVRAGLRDAALQNRLATYQAQQALIYEVALRMRQSLNLQETLTQAVLEIQQILNCDRAIVYRFLPESNGSGVVDVESVRTPWRPLLGEAIEDNCFNNDWFDAYANGQTVSITDIAESKLAPCHIRMLQRYQVQANLVVPIIIAVDALHDKVDVPSDQSHDQSPEKNSEKILWGLLIVHQCDGPRQWQASETQLLEQLSIQLAIAIQQSKLYEQLQSINQQLEAKVQNRTEELQQVNATLQHLNQSLVTSNQDLEQFAYIASHDLREPLRKVKSFAELLSKRYQGQLDETGDRYIHYITNGAVRMQTLINDLLTYARLDKQSLMRTPTDLNQVLRSVLNILSEQIKTKQADVQIGSLPMLSVDALQIEQLFLNLIENALKYNDKPVPKISVTAEQQGIDWLICVHDNGIGIDTQFYDRIFTIFQRLHAKDKYTGTGIGLAICKKIAERHSGSLTVSANADAGSTFCLKLSVDSLM